jgi:hypothetical protein
MLVLLAVPPFSTTCEPSNSVAPLASPQMSCSPPLMVAETSEPPADTISVPPSISV